MSKKSFHLLTAVLALAFLATPVFAASFTLNRIGNLNTEGKNYNEWWYTGTNPILGGTTESDTNVKVTIDDDSYDVNSDESGNWSYNPTTLTSGDHNIKLESSGSEISFLIHIGQDLPANLAGDTATESSGTVPETGSNQLLAIFFLVTALIAGSVLLKNSRERALRAFENRF